MDFQAIVENISEAVFLMDRSGRVVYANPSATMVFGYSSAEMKALDYEQFIHPDDQVGYKETISKLLSSPGAKLQRNYRLKRREENYIWLECTYNHLTSTDGAEILCNFRDVTPRVELGQEAAIIYRFYQVIFEINQAVTRATDEQMLFKKVCDIAIDPGNFKMAWIGMLDQAKRELVPIMHSGEGSQPYLEKMQPISLDDALLSGGPAGTAFRTGVFDYSNDIESDPRMRP